MTMITTKSGGMKQEKASYGLYVIQMSSSKYLAALAVTDNVFLSTLFITWLHDFVPVMTSAGGCKVVIFLSYTASYLSVCFVLCCTSERYVAVCHPLRAQYIFSKVDKKKKNLP